MIYRCDKRSEMMKSQFIVKPPEHLVLSIKRITYDIKASKLLKSLQDVYIQPIIELPQVI